MKKLYMFVGMAAVALLITHIAFAGKPRDDEKNEAAFVQQGKITLDAATSAALQAVPGKAVRAELENENNLPVYEVEIVKPDNQMVDVKVDADSGKVLKVKNDVKDRESEKSEYGHEDKD
jgi:uncharacterized membrane protein YkoI